MANIIFIILRAVTLVFLSSLSNSKPWSPLTWQYSHSTPSEAVMNCIEGGTRSAGTPFSAWIFLNSSSASLGAAGGCGVLDWALAPTMTSPVLRANPQRTIVALCRFEIIPSPLNVDFSRKSVSESRRRPPERKSRRRSSGREIAAFGECSDAVRGTKSQRLDGHRGLTAPGSDQAAAVA